MADVLADIEQFDVEIGAAEPLAFTADTDNTLQLTADDYKVIGVWGTIGGNIENQTDLMLKLAEIAEGQEEAIPIDYINNLE